MFASYHASNEDSAYARGVTYVYILYSTISRQLSSTKYT